MKFLKYKKNITISFIVIILSIIASVNATIVDARWLQRDNNVVLLFGDNHFNVQNRFEANKKQIAVLKEQLKKVSQLKPHLDMTVMVEGMENVNFLGSNVKKDNNKLFDIFEQIKKFDSSLASVFKSTDPLQFDDSWGDFLSKVRESLGKEVENGLTIKVPNVYARRGCNRMEGILKFAIYHKIVQLFCACDQMPKTLQYLLSMNQYSYALIPLKRIFELSQQGSFKQKYEQFQLECLQVQLPGLDVTLRELLVGQLEQLDSYIQSTEDVNLKKIFKDFKVQVKEGISIFKEIMQTLNIKKFYSKEEGKTLIKSWWADYVETNYFDYLTEAAIEGKFSKLVEAISKITDTIGKFSPLFDATVLHLLNNENNQKRLTIIFAGANHARRTARSLVSLGYKQTKVIGKTGLQGHTQALNTSSLSWISEVAQNL